MYLWSAAKGTLHPGYMPSMHGRSFASGAVSRFGARPQQLCASRSHLWSAQFQQLHPSVRLVHLCAPKLPRHSAPFVNTAAESANPG